MPDLGALFDFHCEHCDVVFEDEMHLEDTENGHEKLCPECGGFVEKILGGCHKHLSWASWRVTMGANH